MEYMRDSIFKCLLHKVHFLKVCLKFLTDIKSNLQLEQLIGKGSNLPLQFLQYKPRGELV